MEKFPEPNSLDSMEGLPPLSSEREKNIENTENFNIVELTPDKWREYKVLRLRGLETDPQAWGESVRNEPGKDDDYWRTKLADPSIRMFGMETEGRVVAMAGIQEKPKGRFLLRRVYTIPEMTGKGFSKKLIERVCSEAQARGAKSIELDVVDSAEAARGLYKKMGFVEYGKEDGVKGDGKVHTQILMRKIFE